jgi:hypothetical protein
VNDEELADELQRDNTESFAKSWRDLINLIAAISAELTQKM